MNQHTLKVLEYEKIRTIVASYAASGPGRNRVEQLQPASDSRTTARLLQETREFLHVLESGEVPPLDGIRNIAAVIQKLHAAGMMLSPAELMDTAMTLGAGRRIKNFFQRIEAKSRPAHPPQLLSLFAASIRQFKEAEDRVFGAIDDKAQVKDSASPALRSIRKQIGRMRDDILCRMNGILQDGGFQKVIQEPVITVRDDRYVLPLKPNFRQSLPGVVHGQSGSRATLFVEPLEILEQNNRLSELRMEEQEEVERILRELTAVLASEAGAIEETFHAMAELDGIYARARFGIEYQAVVPGLSGEGRLSLKAARHPLLLVKSRLQPGHDDVVPNMIALEPGQRALILSGPNAGGKTAVLKTVGLLCLMAQAGIPVPAAGGSEVPCFTSVFADIGDEQSLEQDLSTYSAHVRQIAEILSRADGDSLVLLDELGAGTEPGEGAGLGSAVLESLIERGSLTIATTHHNAIKLFGSKTTGAVNAAMEFDPQTLKPTYRLLPGRPGRSYGLEMAARMGIPRPVIDRAWAAVDEDSASLDQLLKQVEHDSRVIAEERQRLERDLQDARRDRENASALLRTAREEAHAVKSRAKTDAASILSALKQKLKDLSRIVATDRTELAQARSEVQALESRLEPEPQVEYREEPGQILHVGDTVRIKGLNKTGIVIMVQGEIVEIEVGAKKIKLPAAGVAPETSSRKATAVSVPGWSAELQQEEDAPSTVNIIGLRVPEALAEVERFVDRAGVHHISVVTIIHGLGTGALKTAVTEYLKNHPLVASIRQGEPAEGGAGVTVAELKK